MNYEAFRAKMNPEARKKYVTPDILCRDMEKLGDQWLASNGIEGHCLFFMDTEAEGIKIHLLLKKMVSSAREESIMDGVAYYVRGMLKL